MTKKEEPLLIGAHTSIAGGVYNALYEGHSIGATTVQIFTANQRQWNTKAIGEEDVKRWKEVLKETGLQKIMSHDSYLINLGSNKEDILAKSLTAFRQEIERCQELEITYLNFHPGSATGASEEECLDKIAESLISFEDQFLKKGDLRLLLECTAGQGSTVGYSFEHLAYIIGKVEKKIPIGVCIDTCHAFVAGYDLTSKAAVSSTLDEFDRVVGLKHLYAFHLNDSMKGLGSRVDRHQDLGKGEIGIECFKALMHDPRTRYLPKYLETPGGLESWKKEIALLRSI
ncbi:deoxyribonuclease IV [Estrella lausannensis]|uniref:Probable endonuclease 4 n=1 Tax=Estrella lausannensis TaxID=483423 RepID=A0A0H5DPB2_9BACT|nr:deoxyribonuclease IV [Estrella lausannensis]CRX37788.1 Endonuclease IV [Estrella lausannensis]